MSGDATEGDSWRGAFLQGLEKGSSVAQAAEAAGVHRSRPYRERQRDSEFAEAWQTAAGRRPAQVGRPKGRSGTVNTGGFIQDEEFNWKLRHPYGLRIFDEMRRSDPTIKWMLALLTTPIRAADARVEPASQDPEDLEVAAFVQNALFEQLDGGFDEFLRQALTYFDFGHSVFERVAELRDVEFTYEVEEIVYDAPPEPPAPPPIAPPGQAAGAAPPAEPPPSPPEGQVPPQLAPTMAPPAPKPRRERTEQSVSRQAFVLARLAPRLQRTIQRWNADPKDSSRLATLTQLLADGQPGGDTVDLPADRLLVFTHEREGDDWRGLSLLRTAYKAYRFKVGLENAEAIGMERSVGLPVVYPPTDADDPELDQVEAAVQAMRQGEQLYIIMPGPKQQPRGETATEGWLIEDLAVQGDAGRGPDINAAIGRYDAEMARNVIAEFMRLGHENTGARATGDVQQDPYYQAIEAHAAYIEDVLNAGVVRPLVDWNYEVTRYPRLCFSKMQAKNLQVVAEAVAKLITAGGMTADPDLENFLRGLLDAPERPLELTEEGAPPAPPQPPPPAAKPDPGTGPDPGQATSEEPAANAQGGGAVRRLFNRLRNRGQTEAFQAFMPWRPLRGPEEAVAFEALLGGLENAESDLVDLATRVLEGQARSAEESAQQAVQLNRPELLDMITLDPAPLEAALADRLQQVYQEGRAHVRAELRRQGGDPGAEAAALQIPLSPGDAARAIGALAKATAEEAAQAATRAVKAGALRAITSRAEPAEGSPGTDPLGAARQGVRNAARGLVGRVFGMGREAELRALADRFDHYVYTALLDNAVCGPCEDADGTTAAGPDEMDPPTPNPECLGGDNCRCMWLGYFSAGGGTGGGAGFA